MKAGANAGAWTFLSAATLECPLPSVRSRISQRSCCGQECPRSVREPRSADVVASAPSLRLRISATAFDEMSREAPDLTTPFLRALGQTLTVRIRASNKHHGESVMMANALK